MNQETTQIGNHKPAPDPGARIAYIQARWHHEIVRQSHAGFVEALEEQGFPAGRVELFDVPGVFEIPLTAKRLARTGRYDVIVAAGFIVDGGIYRHEFVSSAVIDAMMRLQLEEEVTLLSVVLTPQRFHEHEAHQAFFHDHFRTKGREAAEAALMTLENQARLSELRLSA